MLRFRRFSRQSYWEALKKTHEDDISIEGDGWEFGLVEIDLKNPQHPEWGTAIQIRMFDDAVISLKNQKVVLTLISLEKCNTLDNAEKILRRNGFEEAIN